MLFKRVAVGEILSVGPYNVAVVSAGRNKVTLAFELAESADAERRPVAAVDMQANKEDKDG